MLTMADGGRIRNYSDFTGNVGGRNGRGMCLNKKNTLKKINMKSNNDYFRSTVSLLPTKAVKDAIKTTKQNLKTRKPEKFVVILTSQ